MDTMLVSRTYLESLSTADLISLADEYGIDIPENLNRRFIIGELLEAVEDAGEEKKKLYKKVMFFQKEKNFQHHTMKLV